MSATALGLFDGPAPRLRAAPASLPFLDLLAEAMVEALAGEGDLALADALVLLPNRRAAGGLIDAFARLRGGAALLPTIRPLGDLGDDAIVWGAEPIAFDIPPEIAPTRQRLELASLIRARDKAGGGDGDAARAVALANELNSVLESAAAADAVHWEKLPKLADEVDLAQHWEASAEFLKIVAEYWPQRLKADGLLDPAARRAEILRALAREWAARPPQRPVVIAGSTGSMAATRALMQIVAQSPRGVVVFPGLDIDLDDSAWALIGDQHPQHALKETLEFLGVDRRAVAPLGAESEVGRARRAMMREALAPAEKTADWLARLDAAGGAAFIAQGADGLKLIEAATEDEEAAAIALLLREALETPGKTAALTTPDVALARRVVSKLARWGIAPAASHGLPLRETPAGALIALLCELAGDPGDPVALAALMKHPLAASDARARTALEHEALRGPRRYRTLPELRSLLGTDAARKAADRLADILAPLAAPGGGTTLASFADAVAQAAERAVDATQLWRGVDGQAVAALLEDAIAHGEALGPLPARTAPRTLMKLMQAREAPPPPGGDPRIAIWGPLEARLQRRDLMILGGLNEGVWPAPPPDDPFLSRPMRREMGFPSLDARIGLAAHDFAQLVSAPDVVLTRALRRDGAPTVKSRWLWRLETLAKGARVALARRDEALAWARALDRPETIRRARPPAPRPPADARLKRLRVTQAETLIRDPYAVYAQQILKLNVLKPVGQRAEYAERGEAVHRAIELFGEGEDPGELLRLLDEQLARAGFPPERRAAERLRLAASAKAYVRWLAERRGAVQAFIERSGELDLECGVRLRARADRIEIDASGMATILDFKTGAPPSGKQVETGLAPQLTLQAAMLARKAFEDVPRARAHELIYWRFGGADPAPRPVDLKNGAYAAGEEALANLERLLKRYADPAQPFLSSPRVQFAAKYRDYDLLARRKEWAEAEGEE